MAGNLGGKSQGYHSQDDSGDELFEDYETIATVPLHKAVTHNSSIASYPIPYNTQPTQLLHQHAPIACSPSRPSIQVAASSPTPSWPPVPLRAKGGVLAQTMAPPGTSFRPPRGISNLVEESVAEWSDDGEMQYAGTSSDEDTQKDRRDIKPSVFKSRKEGVFAGSGKQRFGQIVANSFYGGSVKNSQQASSLKGSVFDSRNRDDGHGVSRIQAPKRVADTLANAYGNVSNRPSKQRRLQKGPSRGIPVSNMILDDIEDFSQRQKVRRLQTIMSQFSIQECHEALTKKHGNVDDALDFLASLDSGPEEIDLTKSEDEADPLISIPSLPKKPAAKQELKAPVRSILQKYSTASQAMPARPQVVSPEPVISTKPKRKLMRGRKQPSSPLKEPSSPITSPAKPTVSPISISDSDSGIATSESDSGADFNGSLLNFFNTCSTADLVDIASITEDLANLVLEKKPFKSLRQVKMIVDTAAPAKNPKSKSVKRPIGERIVETCERMWNGYRAVDELIKRCQTISKPVTEEMKKWGVDVFGANKSGELDMVTLGDEKSDGSVRDSGIGTPTSATLSADEDGDVVNKPPGKSSLFPQPSIMAKGVVLKDYQVVGINWLSLLFDNRLSCILADDMGLGKTCQVVAFFAHLFEKGEKGPHVVIVPSSTLENWLREFKNFCPKLHVEPYYGSQKERPEIQARIHDNPPNVVITTYTLAKTLDDRKFLRRLRPTVCVYDEGHALKNKHSKAYDQLMKITCQYRLLLTGTPLQNNLSELASLLGFILPEVFEEHKEELEAIFARRATTEDSTHEALLSVQRIAKARSMMTPFILRRKKHQVLKHLPQKTKRVEYCQMTDWQKTVYAAEWDRSRAMVRGRANGEKVEKHYNVLMALRKAAIHPLLLRHSYPDEKLRRMTDAYMEDPEYSDTNPDLVFEDLEMRSDFTVNMECNRFPKLAPFKLPGEPWMESGKVEKLVSLLMDYKLNGDRVLIFSQMTSVMDILENVLATVDIKFFRLDGTTDISARQELIDQFYDETDVTAFMLSTKAGGAGINLACANKVIIFDSSFNPQEDVQAENRAHRVGQTRDVEVVRLVTKGTVEEAIHSLGETKLALDDRVAGEAVASGADDAAMAKKIDMAGAKRVEMMLEEQMKKEQN